MIVLSKVAVCRDRWVVYPPVRGERFFPFVVSLSNHDRHHHHIASIQLANLTLGASGMQVACRVELDAKVGGLLGKLCQFATWRLSTAMT